MSDSKLRFNIARDQPDACFAPRGNATATQATASIAIAVVRRISVPCSFTILNLRMSLSIAGLHQRRRLVLAASIVLFVTDPAGLAVLGDCLGTIAGEIRNLSQFLVGPTTQPFRRFTVEHGPKIPLCFVNALQANERRAVVVAPAGLFAKCSGARVARHPAHAVLDRQPRLVEPSSAERRASGFKPEQAVAWMQLLQLVNHSQRVGISLLAVVDDNEREAGVGLDVAGVGRRLFDQS